MRDVYVIGSSMTNFGKHPGRTLRSLATEATEGALHDASMDAAAVGSVYFSNAVAGIVTGQETIRGQVALRDTGLLGKTIINVENACASGSTAVHLGWLSVASGQVDTAIAVGAEKLTHSDKSVTFRAYASGVDLDEIDEDYTTDRLSIAAGMGGHSAFMDLYAQHARSYMDQTGATQADLAAVVTKARQFGARNPKAQFRQELTVEEVLASREIAWPLTLPMCSPIGDGAASIVLGSREAAERAGGPLVRVRATMVTSGSQTEPFAVERLSQQLYNETSVAPEDLDVVELHDAAAPAELEYYEALGLCAPGEAAKLLASGDTSLGGRTYVNSSGGLLAKGHPVGATGCAQLVEIADQLKGRCGDRQKDGARLGLAHNAGGSIFGDSGALVMTLLERV